MQTICINPLPDSAAKLVGYLHDPADAYISTDVRPCVIVCPGGGYEILASHEAEPVAMRYYTAGYQVFVLYYSVLRGENPAKPPLGLTPLREVSASIMAIRDNCAQWRVAPDKIAVCGFSAGGHLAGSAGVLWDTPELKAVQDTRGGHNRPDAMILCYPVILMEKFAHQGSMENLVGTEISPAYFSLERHVRGDTPPAFLWHTADDDAVPVENTLQFSLALSSAGVPFEAHVFDSAPHGIGLGEDEADDRRYPHCAAWMPLSTEWLGGLFGV